MEFFNLFCKSSEYLQYLGITGTGDKVIVHPIKHLLIRFYIYPKQEFMNRSYELKSHIAQFGAEHLVYTFFSCRCPPVLEYRLITTMPVCFAFV